MGKDKSGDKKGGKVLDLKPGQGGRPAPGGAEPQEPQTIEQAALELFDQVWKRTAPGHVQGETVAKLLCTAQIMLQELLARVAQQELRVQQIESMLAYEMRRRCFHYKGDKGEVRMRTHYHDWADGWNRTAQEFMKAAEGEGTDGQEQGDKKPGDQGS